MLGVVQSTRKKEGYLLRVSALGRNVLRNKKRTADKLRILKAWQQVQEDRGTSAFASSHALVFCRKVLMLSTKKSYMAISWAGFWLAAVLIA